MDRRPPSRLTHVWIPAAAFALAFAAIGAWDLDRRVADAFFYDRAAHDWVGTQTWWAVRVIHSGGGLLVRFAGLSAVSVFLAGFRFAALGALRRPALLVALALALCPAIVGGLKQWTNTDCPRDLAAYGGPNPYVHLLEDRPAGLARGRCFPGSHASTGFALMAFYFALRDRRPRLARGLLAGAIAIGAVFSIGQQARGAHFLSHDLASAAIAWYLLLGLRRLLLELRTPATARLILSASDVQPDDSALSRGRALGRRQRPHPAHARGRRAGVRGVFQRVFRARVPFRTAAAERRRRGGA